MTDHTIEAHFKLSSDMIVGNHSDEQNQRNERIIFAIAQAIGGNQAFAEFEARKLFRAINAMHEAIRAES